MCNPTLACCRTRRRTTICRTRSRTTAYRPSGIQGRKSGLCQFYRHVVCTQDCYFSSLLKTIRTKKFYVCVSHRQCRWIAVWRRANCRYAFFLAVAQIWMAREIRSKLFCNTNWSYSGAAAAVRNCKCLVQVKVTNVCPNKARICETNLSVHICSVYIDKTSVFVNDFNHFANLNLKYPVSRRVCNHCAREAILVLFCLLAEFVYIDVSVFVARNKYNFHSGHCCRCRVCSVGRCWNYYNVSLRIPFVYVVCADSHQSGIFACSA